MSDLPEIKLVFDEPKQRVKPPKHFADLDPKGRKALAVELVFLHSAPIKRPFTSLITTTMTLNPGAIFLRIFVRSWLKSSPQR